MSKKLRNPKFKPAYREGFGILNAQGDFWSPDIFQTVEKAQRHVEEFWRGSKDIDLGQFTIVPAQQRITITPAGRSALTAAKGREDE